MVARVEWSRRTSGEVEEVLGILLQSEYPEQATRRRPGRGDKGIDVYRETPDGWVVYQIKSFTAALERTQWRQITDSWETFRNHVAEVGLVVAAWHLVAPLNPTEGDEAKLAELTAGAAFPCRWQGQDFCDAVAARHPQVIDYYLHDGREAHETSIAGLTSLLRMHTGTSASPGQPLVAADAIPTLEALHDAINRNDPFFRYSLSVESLPSEVLAPLENCDAANDMVVAEQMLQGKRLVMIKVYPRFKDALLERSVAGNISLEAAPGSPEAEALQDFFTFGSPLTKFKVAEASLDAPGGLGHLTGGEATITLGPVPVDAKDLPVFRLDILDEAAGRVVASIDMASMSRSQGIGGDGMEFTGLSGARAVSFRLRLRADGHVNLQYKVLDLTGTDPSEAAADLQFIASFHRPNQILLRERHARPFGPPIPITADVYEEAAWLEQTIEICDALATFQSLSHHPIRLPDLAEQPIARIEHWLFEAMLIRGEITDRTWDRMAINRHPGPSALSAAEAEFTALIRQPLVIELADLTLELGIRQLHLKTAQIAPGSDPEDEHLEVIPGSDPMISSSWLPTEAEAEILPWVPLTRASTRRSEPGRSPA